MYDLLITNAQILDGTGSPAVKGSVAVTGDTIIECATRCLQPVPKARETINAEGLALSPGFIDIHGHSDLMALTDPFPLAKVQQGVTTDVAGNCGISIAPLSDASANEMRQLSIGVLGRSDLEWTWRGFGEYLDRVQANRPVNNIAVFVGHNTVRAAAMGMDDVPVTPKRLKVMKDLVAQAMDEGAFGFSIGLIYIPGYFATEDELAALAAVAGKKGGIYATHMRNEADDVLKSTATTIATAKKANVPLQIVHLKAAGRRNWSKMAPLIEMIAKARAAGEPVDYDQYPYTAGSTGLVSLLPRWAQAGGVQKIIARLKSPADRKKIAADLNNRKSRENFVAMTGWEAVFISSVRSEKNRAVEGKSLPDIAKMRGQTITDALFDILIEENGDAAMIVFSMSEDNIKMGLKQDWGMVGSDGLFGGRSHPRLHGTFPRVIGKYSREEKVIPLEVAVKKMTSLPARKLGLKDRGVIAKGMKADLVLFDPLRIRDGATYEDPLRFAEGIARVIVNGKTVMDDGKYTGARPGQVLRR